MTSGVAVSTPSTHIMVSKHHFSLEVQALERHGWFQIWGRDVQNEPGTSCNPGNREAVKHFWGHVKKYAGDNVKGPPLAKEGIIWASIRITAVDWNMVICVQMREFTILQRTEKQTHLSSFEDLGKPAHYFGGCHIKEKNQALVFSGMYHILQKPNTW